MALDLWNVSDEDLLDLVRADIQASTNHDPWALDAPVPADAWVLVHSERRAELTLLIAVARGASGTATVVLRNDNGEPAVEAIAVRAPYSPGDSLVPWTEGVVDTLRGRTAPVSVVVFASEPDVAAIRATRIGPDTSELQLVSANGFAILSDPEPNRPISGFTDVLKRGVWQECFATDTPYSLGHVAALYDVANGRRMAPHELLAGELGIGEDRWGWLDGIVYDRPWDTFRPMILPLLEGFRYPEHAGGIGALSAAIYGQGHWLYDAIEAAYDRIDGAVLYYFLLFEKEEFLPPDVARRYHALCARLARQLGTARSRELWNVVRVPGGSENMDSKT